MRRALLASSAADARACTLTDAQLSPAWATQKRPRPPSGLGNVPTVTGARSPTVTLTCPTLRPARPKANEPIPGAARVWSVTAPLAILRRPQRSRRAGADPVPELLHAHPETAPPRLGARTYSSQRAILVAPLAIVTASWAPSGAP